MVVNHFSISTFNATITQEMIPELIMGINLGAQALIGQVTCRKPDRMNVRVLGKAQAYKSSHHIHAASHITQGICIADVPLPRPNLSHLQRIVFDKLSGHNGAAWEFWSTRVNPYVMPEQGAILMMWLPDNDQMMQMDWAQHLLWLVCRPFFLSEGFIKDLHEGRL